MNCMGAKRIARMGAIYLSIRNKIKKCVYEVEG